LIWLFFSTLCQGRAILDVVLLFDPNAQELGNIFPIDNVNNFLSEEVQPSFVNGHTFSLA
jgi:hypothetical protein